MRRPVQHAPSTDVIGHSHHTYTSTACSPTYILPLLLLSSRMPSALGLILISPFLLQAVVPCTQLTLLYRRLPSSLILALILLHLACLVLLRDDLPL
jgi:hypothetical protein